MAKLRLKRSSLSSRPVMAVAIPAWDLELKALPCLAVEIRDHIPSRLCPPFPTALVPSSSRVLGGSVGLVVVEGLVCTWMLSMERRLPAGGS